MDYDWITIYDIASHLRSESDGLFSSSDKRKFEGLTLKQKDALVLVRRLESEYPDGISLKLLAKRLDLSPATVSELVDNLVKQKFLTRERSTVDRRSICIKLEKETSKKCKISEESFSKTFNKLLAELAENEKEIFLASLSKIQQKIKQSQENRNNDNDQK
ncbi:MarR family transcriptional regulator [Lentisphaerota bacterium WC36G]|nr:MarR family transcriptional regulator [Lentisphaerae bacterium WC36]